MAYLSRDQVRQIIAKAPPGTSPAGIVAGLRASGHQLEGYDSGPQLMATPSPYQRLKNRAVASLPTIGGLSGGLIGSVGGPALAIAGAGLGGTIGKTATNLISGQRSD